MATLDRRKASMETRDGLLRELSVPSGVATVARRPGADGDSLIVRVVSRSWLPPKPRIESYEGFPVIYEVSPPPKISVR